MAIFNVYVHSAEETDGIRMGRRKQDLVNRLQRGARKMED